MGLMRGRMTPLKILLQYLMPNMLNNTIMTALPRARYREALLRTSNQE